VSTLDLNRFDAWLFDLDGVLTDTAVLHTHAWKSMLDDYLRARAEAEGAPFEEFTQADYLAHVDGKPRQDGVRDFLAARGITLPEGTPSDPSGVETVHGLGNRKNALVTEAIATRGVETYPASVDVVRMLHEAGIRTALVSSSRNAPSVLEAAGIDALFDTLIDGVVATELGLRGKPAPDTFLAAAERLDASPERSVVVEDAVSGVLAGKAGGFGLVVGIARHGNEDELLGAGAHRVVTDLSELTFVSTHGRSEK
jgi:beta-phosphoglucomutase family hydrolase